MPYILIYYLDLVKGQIKTITNYSDKILIPVRWENIKPLCFYIVQSDDDRVIEGYLLRDTGVRAETVKQWLPLSVVAL